MKKGIFSHHEVSSYLYATDYWYAASFDVMLCFQCEKELNRKKFKQKKTVLYRGKKKSRRCVAMGINANESSNVGANMVTPCLDRQQFQRCYLAIEKHVSMKKAILSKQHDQNEIFITNVKFVNRTNVMAWSVEVASGILGKIMVINNGEFHSNRLKCWPLRSIYFLYFSH